MRKRDDVIPHVHGGGGGVGAGVTVKEAEMMLNMPAVSKT